MIPSARFGEIKITEVDDATVKVKLFSLYKGGVKEVAANKTFCLWILTQALKDLHTMTWLSQDTNEVNKVKALLKRLSESASTTLTKYKNYISPGFTDIKGVDEFRKILLDIPVRKKEKCTFDTKKKADSLEMQRYLDYGYPKELLTAHPYIADQMVTDVQLIPVSIPITDEGFTEYLNNPKTGFEKQMYRLGFICRSNNPNKLETYIITPVLEKQLDDILKYVDPAGIFQVAIPKDEPAFINAAKVEIGSVSIGTIVSYGKGPYEEEAEMTFTVKNPELLKHLEVGRGLSF